LWAAGVHLGISVGVAGLAAALVFWVWYPYPYREISGGRELFLLMVSVDVALGPLITFTVFNRSKPKAELRRDLTVVGVIQLAALAYGLWTVAVARPAYLVFEIDRFRVVHAVEIDPALLAKAAPAYQNLPLWGPKLLATRSFKDSTESMVATLAALSGAAIGARPELWQDYGLARERVLRVAHPAAALRKRFPDRAEALDAILQERNKKLEDLSFVPMMSRKAIWTVLIDSHTAEVVGFLPVDSF